VLADTILLLFNIISLKINSLPWFRYPSGPFIILSLLLRIIKGEPSGLSFFKIKCIHKKIMEENNKNIKGASDIEFK